MRPTKKLFSACSLILVCMIAASCASSTDTASAGAGYATSEQIEGDPYRMVCKRDKETGSRLSSRTCKTAAEWERERELNVEAMRNATKSPMAPSNLPTAGGG